MKEVFCQFFDYSKALWLLSRLPAITRAWASADREFRRVEDIDRQRDGGKREKVGEETGKKNLTEWTDKAGPDPEHPSPFCKYKCNQ